MINNKGNGNDNNKKMLDRLPKSDDWRMNLDWTDKKTTENNIVTWTPWICSNQECGLPGHISKFCPLKFIPYEQRKGPDFDLLGEIVSNTENIYAKHGIQKQWRFGKFRENT